MVAIIAYMQSLGTPPDQPPASPDKSGLTADAR
jgi:hypothetical protein